MANQTGLVKTSDAVTKRLEEMIARGRSSQAFLGRVAYPLYQRRQMKRWMTENASEDTAWARYKNKDYAEWKAREFAGYPGNGQRMLIRTSKLLGAVTGLKTIGDALPEPRDSWDSGLPDGHHVMITDKSLTVSTDLEYAKYVNEKRNFWRFRSDFKDSLTAAYAKWFVGGKE